MISLTISRVGQVPLVRRISLNEPTFCKLGSPGAVSKEHASLFPCFPQNIHGILLRVRQCGWRSFGHSIDDLSL